MVGVLAQLAGLHALVNDVGVAGGGGKRGDEVFVGKELVVDGAGLNNSGSADERGHTVTALPVGSLFTAVWRAASIRPGH
jgi:hypothetical protein